MLDGKRVKEAEGNVRAYLREGLLRKTAADRRISSILLENSRESLKVAEEVHRQGISDLWVIVCSYYAMYYYANAVLLELGYKVGNRIVHKVTADALIVYVRNKLKASLIEEYERTKEEALSLAGMKADSLIKSFDAERSKRGIIQYRTLDDKKRSKAATSLQRAKEFTKEMEKLILTLGK